MTDEQRLAKLLREHDADRLCTQFFADRRALLRGWQWADACAEAEPGVGWEYVAGYLHGAARVTESVRSWYGEDA